MTAASAALPRRRGVGEGEEEEEEEEDEEEAEDDDDLGEEPALFFWKTVEFALRSSRIRSA
jgi:hypothetical protein